ncbi:hypothetical protein ON010_g472 [Phytophthora cinnamomi]|nr:hypothetical protein ON010_g472 [Phytophthora cinnamomi]
MGQQVSLPAAVTQPPGEHAQLRPLQAPYVPLCDVLKAGDSAVASTAAEDTKDAMDKILEFGAALLTLNAGRCRERSLRATADAQPRAAAEGAHEPRGHGGRAVPAHFTAGWAAVSRPAGRQAGRRRDDARHLRRAGGGLREELAGSVPDDQEGEVPARTTAASCQNTRHVAAQGVAAAAAAPNTKLT